MRSFGILLKNEWKLSVRNMNMVIFAVLLPLVVLIILGMIYGAEPAFPGRRLYVYGQSFRRALHNFHLCGRLDGLPLVVAEYREQKILKRFQQRRSARPGCWQWSWQSMSFTAAYLCLR